jgi:Calx-beta domain
MTPTLAFLSRSSRSFLCLLSALAPLQAEVVEFDLDQVPMPTSGSVALALPYNEQGLRMESTFTSCFVVGPANSSFTGVKALTPPSQANGQPVNMQLYSPAGRIFAVRSATIHPYTNGQAVNIGFTRFFNGSGSTQGQSTGTALAGTTVTFNSSFNRVGNLSWQMTSTGGIYQRFQISRIVVEFDGTLTTTSFTVTEAAGTAAVPIQLDSPRTTDTTVNWEVTGLTASQPGDFTFPGGSSTGTVTIPAGQTVAFVNVPIVNDSTNESPETLRVRYTTTATGVLFPGGNGFIDATVTIASDDGVTTFPNWMTAHGLTSTAADPDADPNGDGISNIECWLFRLNPAGPNPPAWLERRAVMSAGGTDPGLTFFVPTPLTSDVRIIFSQTTNLGAWTEQTRRTGFGLGSLWSGSGSARVVESSSPAGRTITLRASVPVGRRPKVFLRNVYEHVPGGGAS